MALPAKMKTVAEKIATTVSIAAVMVAGSTLVPSAAQAALSPNPCGITFYGYPGIKICGTVGTGYVWSDSSNVEYFVIGQDYAIWHIWPSSNGWHSLGGEAHHARSDAGNNGAWATTNPVGVKTVGTTGATYCRNWPYAATNTWYTC